MHLAVVRQVLLTAFASMTTLASPAAPLNPPPLPRPPPLFHLFRRCWAIAVLAYRAQW